MNIIFTDLDGTLLDHTTYSFDAAKSSLEYLIKRGVPIIFCTSKTRSEIEYWRTKLDNDHPFISENGGGIYIPKNHFPFPIINSEPIHSFERIRLGSPLSILETTMNYLERNFNITSFLSMDTKKIMELTDLPYDQACLASQREFDIPFVLNKETDLTQIRKEVERQNLYITKGGRFYHLIGDNDKGKAVKIITNFFQKQYDAIQTIGIGDSENDFPMLNVVHKPYLVKRKDDTYASSAYPHVSGIGPIGWKQIIEKEIKNK